MTSFPSLKGSFLSRVFYPIFFFNFLTSINAKQNERELRKRDFLSFAQKKKNMFEGGKWLDVPRVPHACHTKGFKFHTRGRKLFF